MKFATVLEPTSRSNVATMLMKVDCQHLEKMGTSRIAIRGSTDEENELGGWGCEWGHHE